MCRADVDQIIFFTGNDCKGKLAGSTIATPGNCFRNIRWMTRRDSCWEPEAARSMLIRKNFPVLGTIHVCDHATGCFEDGFAKITVKQQPTTVLPKLIKDLVFEGAQMPQAPIAYCVNTFEHSYEDIWVKVEFDSGVMQRGLDGAVSRIGVCYFGNEGNPQTDENTMPYDHLQDAEDSSQDI